MSFDDDDLKPDFLYTESPCPQVKELSVNFYRSRKSFIRRSPVRPAYMPLPAYSDAFCGGGTAADNILLNMLFTN